MYVGRTYRICPLCPTGHRPFEAAAQKGLMTVKRMNKKSNDKDTHIQSHTNALTHTKGQIFFTPSHLRPSFSFLSFLYVFFFSFCGLLSLTGKLTRPPPTNDEEVEEKEEEEEEEEEKKGIGKGRGGGRAGGRRPPPTKQEEK